MKFCKKWNNISVSNFTNFTILFVRERTGDFPHFIPDTNKSTSFIWFRHFWVSRCADPDRSDDLVSVLVRSLDWKTLLSRLILLTYPTKWISWTPVTITTRNSGLIRRRLFLSSSFRKLTSSGEVSVSRIIDGGTPCKTLSVVGDEYLTVSFPNVWGNRVCVFSSFFCSRVSMKIKRVSLRRCRFDHPFRVSHISLRHWDRNLLYKK